MLSFLKAFEGPIWIALGILISLLACDTGIGSFREPGVGFVGLASGLFLIVIGSVMTISRRENAQQEGKGKNKSAMQTSWARPSFKFIYTLALLALYALLLNPLGYVIATFLVMFGLFFDPVKRRWLPPLLASLASVAVTYTVFEIWLKSQLPRGILPWW
jgi:hypothetical protein